MLFSIICIPRSNYLHFIHCFYVLNNFVKIFGTANHQKLSLEIEDVGSLASVPL